MIVKESLLEKLSPAGALYGFGGWITTRYEPVTVGAYEDAAIVAELIDEFIKKQGIDEPEDGWEKDLIPMEKQIKKEKGGF